MSQISNLLSAEWILERMPNGGDAVLLRTLWISFWFYMMAIAIKSYCDAGILLSFSVSEFKKEFGGTLPWLGAIMGGTYAALYSRFSSQWGYLADLYNQQMALACSLPESELSGENYTAWQAAFIEDAMVMHLATKDGFCVAIHEMLQDEDIFETLCASVNRHKVQKLKDKLKKKLGGKSLDSECSTSHSRTPTKMPKERNMKTDLKYYIVPVGQSQPVGFILNNRVHFISGAWPADGEIVNNTIKDDAGGRSRIMGDKLVRSDGHEFRLISEEEMNTGDS
jgi:hypothetical protein